MKEPSINGKKETTGLSMVEALRQTEDQNAWRRQSNILDNASKKKNRTIELEAFIFFMIPLTTSVTIKTGSRILRQEERARVAQGMER